MRDASARRNPSKREEECLSFRGQDKIGKELRRSRVRGVCAHADALRACHQWLGDDIVDRRTFPFQRLDVAVIHREADGDVARRDERGEQNVALTEGGLGRGEPSHRLHAPVAWRELDEGGHPLGVGGLQRQASLPSGIREALDRRVDRQLELRELVLVLDEPQPLDQTAPTGVVQAPKTRFITTLGWQLPIANDDARLLIDRDGGLAGPRGQAARTALYLFERDAGVALLRSG